jgi:hypothetical protein
MQRSLETMVWFKRCSPYSRYGRVRLELFTTPNWLSEQGDIDTQWGPVPLGVLVELAAHLIEAAVGAGDSEAVMPRMIEVEHRGPAKVIEFAPPNTSG